ncbi:MAG: SURF1 family protein [Pseudomonadota bacterium]
MARWQFRPPLWAVLGMVPALALLVSLGTWQLHRGQDRAAMLAQYASAGEQAAVAFDPHQPATKQPVHVQLRGHFEDQRQLLLDNQSNQKRPGYEVLTPLRLADGTLLLVNRGWIPQSGTRDQPPSPTAPQGEQLITGYWHALPEPGMRLGQPACEKATRFPQIVNYPNVAELRCTLGEQVLNGDVLLDANVEGGFVREWNFDNGFPPSRHYGYAAQWYALALTLIAFFIKLNLKRSHD